MPGSVVLVGGEPGIGKSTLLLQVAARLSERVGSVLYVSAEESAQQVKMRADRLDASAPGLFLLPETSLENDPRGGEGRAFRGDRRGFDPDDRLGGFASRRRLGHAGARLRQPPAGAREDDRRAGLPHRPRHEGRDARGPQDARASRRRGSLLRGRTLPRAPCRAGAEEPVRPRARARDLRDDGRRPRRGREPVGALPRKRRGRAARLRRARRRGGHAAAPPGSPGPHRRSESTGARAAPRSASTGRASRSFSRSSSATAECRCPRTTCS